MRPAAVAILVLTLAAPAAVGAVPVEPTPLALAARSALDRDPVRVASFPGGPTLQPDWETDDWDWVDRAPPPEGGTGEKSVVRAVASSALLPGLGERYVGRTRRAGLFHFAEGVIWAAFAYYRIEGERRKDRFVEFAQLNGGASPDGDDDYYEHIGFWLSLEEWHDIVRRDARLRFPDDGAAQAEFFERTKRYDRGAFWEWPDDETRTRYRVLRSRSERSFRNARLVAGVALVNRLASMIDALALTRSHNREIREREARLDLRIGPRQTVDGLVIGPVLTTRY